MAQDFANSDPDGDNRVLRCAWLINPGQTPQQDVRVTVTGGVVTDISPVSADERSMIQPVALMPRFVNAHTHLEFSDLRSPLPPPTPFPDWIRAVIRYRTERSEDADSPAAEVRDGTCESNAAGVDLIGEITTSQTGLEALRISADAARVTAISFRELIGFSNDRIQQQLQTAQSHIEALSRADGSNRIFPGLSPHAPYSVHPDIVAATVDLAAVADVPVAMHLAETRDEIELLESKTGTFVNFLKSLKLWDADVLSSMSKPVHYLELLSRAPHALAIHGNYLSQEEIRFLARHNNVSVVYCPRTHAWFGHPAHPWQKLRAAGATVILGTDSRASNPDLSIWKELQHVARQPNTPPLWQLLPMITTTAAAAMGHPVDEFIIQIGKPLRALQVHCHGELPLNAALTAVSAVPLS